MRKLIAGIFISIAVAGSSQDRSAEVSSSAYSPPDFASLEPFVKGLALSSREVAVYRVRAATVPNHRHSKSFVIVWTENGSVTEERDGGLPTTRTFNSGQIDFYPGGTKHSLHVGKGLLRFTLVELRQQNQHKPTQMPREPTECENVVEFPEGGFACLINLAPDQQVTIPELDMNSIYIAVDSGRVRTTTPRHYSDAHYREGWNQYLPGYEKHDLRNLGRRPLRLVLVVPPPAQ